MITISVLRRESASDAPHWQDFLYESLSQQDTVATALTALNARTDLRDAGGEKAAPIGWECSCLQKKCGACAMVINGRPQLACAALLNASASGRIRVEPLRKFPVVRDLIVDRSILFENLKILKLWLTADAQLSDRGRDTAYEGSECIQCGCCLEVCPNFYPGGSFYGMASVPLTSRLLTELSPEEYREIAKLYGKHFYAGCGKSLACRDICPRGIDTEKLLVNANALAIWKRKKKD